MEESSMYQSSFREGPIGRQGFPGEPGLRGPQGKRGYRGNDGHTGPTGHSETGPTGSVGPTGVDGPRGHDSGLTGPTGPDGPMGPTGQTITYYTINDYSIYKLKWMTLGSTLTSSPVYQINQQTNSGIDTAVLYVQSFSNIDKYIVSMTVSQSDYQLIYHLSASQSVQRVNMTTSGDRLSVPICCTQVNYVTDRQVDVVFQFDGVESINEYVFISALYDLSI